MDGKSDKKVLNHEENIQNGTKVHEHTESDAVHPRFAGINEEATEEFRREFHYYCLKCRFYFAPTVLGLREHFKVGRIDHERSASCIYCQGPVYSYSIDNRIKVYHDCGEYES